MVVLACYCMKPLWSPMIGWSQTFDVQTEIFVICTMYVSKVHKNEFFGYIAIMSETCHHYRMATKLIPLEKSVNPNSDLSY